MLSREDIVAIASRIFAVFAVIYTLRSTGAILQLLPQEGAGPYLGWFAAVNALIGLVVAALFWFFPLTVARKLLPVLHEPRPALTAPRADIEDTAVFVLGLWVLVSAIPDAFYWAVLLQQTRALGYGEAPLLPDQKAAIATTAIQLVLGLWLIVGARGLLGLLRRLREAGSGNTRAAQDSTNPD